MFVALLFPAVAAAEGAWIDVPFVQQQKQGCGSASAAMVMRYWMDRGAAVEPHAADASRIQEVLHDPSARGIHGSRLSAYLEENGFSVHVVNAEPADVEHHLAMGRPLIAAIRPRGQKTFHYVVVTGVDPGSDQVLLNDPARGRLIRVKGSRFRKMWSASDNWTLLAVPLTNR